MASEITDKQYNSLVTELKKNPGNSERHYAEKTGIPLGQIGSVLYKAEVEADPKLKLPATAKGVVDGRKKGLRIPRIAAYSGLSQAEVKRLYKESTGEDITSVYTGRGRKSFDGNGSSSNKSTGSGRRGGPARGTSGRRAAAAPAKRGAASKATASTGTSGRRRGASPK